MARKSSISFKKRDEVDEIYAFPILHESATFATRNATVMVEYNDDGTVLIIAGKIPGMNGYYKNYPDVIEDDERKKAQHEFARCLLDEALDFLSDYDPETDYSKSNNGNKSMKDIYVEVPEEKRDKVVMKIWEMFNFLRDEYIEFLEEWAPEDYQQYPELEEEVVRISRTSELHTNSCVEEFRRE